MPLDLLEIIEAQNAVLKDRVRNLADHNEALRVRVRNLETEVLGGADDAFWSGLDRLAELRRAKLTSRVLVDPGALETPLGQAASWSRAVTAQADILTDEYPRLNAHHRCLVERQREIARAEAGHTIPFDPFDPAQVDWLLFECNQDDPDRDDRP